MPHLENDIEGLRQKIAHLEKRADELTKKYERLLGKVEQFTPELNAVMREGLPLEIFARATLLNSGYEVHGYYPFYLNNVDGTRVERSVDIHASKKSIYTVPEGKGQRSGTSWPELDNLLVEVKQRRDQVRWLFCNLPIAGQQSSIAGEKVPIVNAGFELRPTEQGFASSGNPKDVNNAIAQLNQAYIPFMVDRELGHDGLLLPHAHRHQHGDTRENTWLLLVTNATLKVLNSSLDFNALLSGSNASQEIFVEVPWLVFKPESSLSLLHHQRSAIKPFRDTKRNEAEMSLPEIMADHTHEVHIVHHTRLSDFIALVKDPPRIEKIEISFTVDGGKPNTATIE